MPRNTSEAVVTVQKYFAELSLPALSPLVCFGDLNISHFFAYKHGLHKLMQCMCYLISNKRIVILLCYFCISDEHIATTIDTLKLVKLHDLRLSGFPDREACFVEAVLNSFSHLLLLMLLCSSRPMTTLCTVSLCSYESKKKCDGDSLKVFQLVAVFLLFFSLSNRHDGIFLPVRMHVYHVVVNPHLCMLTQFRVSVLKSF